ncbi:hypothetical protein NL676_002987 [Syzygium grande]|nr:hypothetical protein NL676_002987 [Syzygium grande]
MDSGGFGEGTHQCHPFAAAVPKLPPACHDDDEGGPRASGVTTGQGQTRAASLHVDGGEGERRRAESKAGPNKTRGEEKKEKRLESERAASHARLLADQRAPWRETPRFPLVSRPAPGRDSSYRRQGDSPPIPLVPRCSVLVVGDGKLRRNRAIRGLGRPARRRISPTKAPMSVNTRNRPGPAYRPV